ncbi:hypothetical protein D3C87_1411680 [compost metagenome]
MSTFDKWPDAQPQTRHALKLSSAFSLGNDHAFQLRMLPAESQVFGIVLSVLRVDPHHHIGEVRGLQVVSQIVPSLCFEPRLHRVFKIYNDPVSTSSNCFGKALRTTSWHKERRTYGIHITPCTCRESMSSVVYPSSASIWLLCCPSAGIASIRCTN